MAFKIAPNRIQISIFRGKYSNIFEYSFVHWSVQQNVQWVLHVFIGIRDCSWASMSFYGHPWVFIGINECLWASMSVHWHQWVFMGIHECTWKSMSVHGHPWFFIGIHDCSWASMTFHGHSWMLLKYIFKLKIENKTP